MEKISRKGFLKIAAAAAMSGVTAGALAACNSASSSTASGAAGQYIPGTYEGTAEGISSTVKVTMTFSDSAVTDVVVDTSGETASFGAAAADELREQLMAAGSAEIDGVSGSTITSDAVMKAAKSCYAQAKGEAVVSSVQLPTGDANDWLGKEPDIDEAAITETIDTDIVIVGAGNGGMFAAAYAAALNAKGVVTSIGHSDATYDECIAAINAGASCFTHTYNGQRGLHHREPGVVGAAMTTPNTYAEIICDGKHVNPAAIKALLQAKGWQHTVLITDCLGCGGMPEGSYTSGGMDVIMKDNLCWLADGKSIAGSVLTLAQGVKNIVDWGLASADIAIRMATEVPARSAHVEDKCGSIMPGRDADFVVFNPDLTLVETHVGGNSVGNAFAE